MLLSIIVPTKNRQFTALFAIKSALTIPFSDMEVVIQDCSDTNTLLFNILDEIGNDPRINYYYDSTQPSMTDNWNSAFNRAKGEYLCAIGDDDAVIPNIYEIALWAKQNEIPAVVQNEFLMYFWPDYKPSEMAGKLYRNSIIQNKIEIFDDIKNKIRNYSTLRNHLTYIYLPQAYHCIFSNKIRKNLIDRTGFFLDGTSVDVYSAIAFSSVIDTYGKCYFPFTIRGACSTSNSQRITKREMRKHFKEYKKINLPKEVPPGNDMFTTISESFIVACKNTGQEKLISNIDLPMLYGNIVLWDWKNFFVCCKKLFQNVTTIKGKIHFFTYLLKCKVYGLIKFFRIVNSKKSFSSFSKHENVLEAVFSINSEASFKNPIKDK